MKNRIPSVSRVGLLLICPVAGKENSKVLEEERPQVPRPVLTCAVPGQLRSYTPRRRSNFSKTPLALTFVWEFHTRWGGGGGGGRRRRRGWTSGRGAGGSVGSSQTQQEERAACDHHGHRHHHHGHHLGRAESGFFWGGGLNSKTGIYLSGSFHSHFSRFSGIVMKAFSWSSWPVTPKRGHRGHRHLKKTKDENEINNGHHNWLLCDRETRYNLFSLRQEVMLPEAKPAWLKTSVAPETHVACNQIYTDRFILPLEYCWTTARNELTNCKWLLCVRGTHLHTHINTHTSFTTRRGRDWTLWSPPTIMSLSRNSLMLLHFTVGAQ